MPDPRTPAAEAPALTLLFICTHNRCRSILCEALARALGGGRIAAFSAGSQPSGAVHPNTLAHLARRGVNTAGLSSKSWHTCTDLSPDAVITVCDSAAGEHCPLWLEPAVRVHWGLPDPSRVEGTPAARAAAFDAVIATIEQRLRRLLELDLPRLRSDALRDALQRIADEEH
jgi:arsenate reductase